MAEHIQPTVDMIERLLSHPDIAGHVSGLSRLRVAVNPEVGAVSGHGRAGGVELIITGPVDAETAELAFHFSRVIPRDDGGLRVDFSFPPADLSGTARFDASGLLVAVEANDG